MKLFHPAPKFELADADGELVTRDHFAGRYLILYFYPKANTPGCTREAQEFTARKRDFARLDADVVGVSPDGLNALCKFIETRELDIPLLSDPHKGVAEQFGALNEKGGILRSTFLIDRWGVVRWQWKKVKVDGHVDEVYALLEQLRAADEAVNPLLGARRSKRAMGGKVSKATIKRLASAAHLAPSCFNMQPWRFIAATGASLEAVHAGLKGGNAWAKPAPVIFAVVSRPELDCQLSMDREYWMFDSGMAAMSLQLQATQMGLYAHPMAGFDPAVVKEALAIPDGYVLIALVAVGRPVDISVLDAAQQKMERAPRDRKPLGEVLAFDRFDFDTG